MRRRNHIAGDTTPAIGPCQRWSSMSFTRLFVHRRSLRAARNYSAARPSRPNRRRRYHIEWYPASSVEPLIAERHQYVNVLTGVEPPRRPTTETDGDARRQAVYLPFLFQERRVRGAVRSREGRGRSLSGTDDREVARYWAGLPLLARLSEAGTALSEARKSARSSGRGTSRGSGLRCPERGTRCSRQESEWTRRQSDGRCAAGVSGRADRGSAKRCMSSNCQRRRKNVPARRRKNVLRAGWELVPVVHGRDPRAGLSRRALRAAGGGPRVGGACGPTPQKSWLSKPAPAQLTGQQ